MAAERTGAEARVRRGPDGRVIPNRIGSCRIEEEIARGGMGVVYRAFDEKLGRTVALKLMHGGALAAPGALERFHREARAAASIRHPGVVQVHDVGEEHGLPYLTMDLVEGRTLAKVVAEDRPSPEKAASLAARIARALHAAHEKGIIHRDVKPSNVLVDERGEPFVTDFGLARFEDPDESRLTRSGAILGTPAYMPPEQALGKRSDVGARSDVYALGATLYEMLTLRPPFLGSSHVETVRQVIETDPVPPRTLDPRVPRDLETIVLKALQKEPARRYATALDLATDLDRFLRHEPVAARPATLLDRVAKAVRRHPVATLVALAALGTALAALGTALEREAAALADRRAGEVREAAQSLRQLESERGRLRRAPLRLVVKDRDYRELLARVLSSPDDAARRNNLDRLGADYVANVSSASFVAVVQDDSDDDHLGEKIRLLGLHSTVGAVGAALQDELPKRVPLGELLEDRTELPPDAVVRLGDELFRVVVAPWSAGRGSLIALVVGHRLDAAWSEELTHVLHLRSAEETQPWVLVRAGDAWRVVAARPAPGSSSVGEAFERAGALDDVREEVLEGRRWAVLARRFDARGAPGAGILFAKLVPRGELRLRRLGATLVPLGAMLIASAALGLVLMQRLRRRLAAREREAARRFDEAANTLPWKPTGGTPT